MRIKYVLYLLVGLSTQMVVAQDTLSVKEIYFDTDLAYQYSNDELFTGVVQKVRKNGHLVYEEFYEDGIILEFREYFNFVNKRLARKILYYREHPLTQKEKINYITNKNGKFIERTFYDTYQTKTLITRHNDTTLVYKCYYKNGKKEGQEFCFDNDSNPMITEFINGKRVRN